jgi:hypothetical protein
MSLKVQCAPIEVADAFASFKNNVMVLINDPFDLDQIKLPISDDYYSSFRRRVGPSVSVTAEEYLRGHSDLRFDKSLLCPEMPLPRHLATGVQLILPPNRAWTTQAVALLHAGRTGCMAPLHFDWDHSWVAHVCLTGRKRVFLFPPRSGWLLSPVINTSSLCVPRFSQADRKELVDRLGGIEILLRAGEGLLFPSLFWHGVLYEESSLSLSVRFEAKAGGRPFGALPRLWWLQRLLWCFFQHGYGKEADQFLITYLRCLFDEKSTWRKRYRRITALCRRVLLEYGEQQGAEQLVGENFLAEVSLASRELRQYYSNTENINGRHEDDEHIASTLEYLFEGLPRPPDALGSALAAYALRLRQGLRPQRGLVQIVGP